MEAAPGGEDIKEAKRSNPNDGSKTKLWILTVLLLLTKALIHFTGTGVIVHNKGPKLTGLATNCTIVAVTVDTLIHFTGTGQSNNAYLRFRNKELLVANYSAIAVADGTYPLKGTGKLGKA